MPKRRAESHKAQAPRTSLDDAGVDLRAIALGIASDLDDLRAGRIGVREAEARATLAKQLLRSVNLLVEAQRQLAEAAVPLAIDDRSER